MLSNREIYFQLINKHNKYLTDYVIKLLLCEISGYESFTELSINFDENNKSYDEIIAKSKRIELGEPYQYVLNKAYFLNEPYYVDKNVLIPRQETEQLIIEIVKKIEVLQSFYPKTICDICTGSGILAIELKKRYPESDVIGTDIDENALKVANKNAKDKGIHIEFRDGDLLDPIIGDKRFDLIVCNPPYIEDRTTIDKQVFEYEPHLALLAKPGTYFYEQILKNLLDITNERFLIGFEIGEDQELELTEMIHKYLKNINFEFKIDLYGKTRFLLLWKE